MGQTFSRIALPAGLAAVLPLPSAAATSSWQIDPAHSSAQFAVKHLMISTVRGAFTSVKGSLQFDDKDITKSTVDVTIDGNTKEAVLDVDGPTAPVKDPWGNQRIGVSASSKITRQDFGITYGPGMIGDEISITIDAELIQKK